MMFRAILATVVSVALSWAFVTPALGQETPLEPAEALAVDAQFYVAMYDVPLDEAMRRLSVMENTSADVDQLSRETGPDLAGIYFDNADFALVVRMRGATRADRTLVRRARLDAREIRAETRAQRRAERRVLRSRLNVRDADVERAEDILAQDVSVRVRYRGGSDRSRFDLSRTIDTNLAAFRALPGFELAYPDDRTGQIVLIFNTPDLARDAELPALLGTPVRTEIVPGGGFQEVGVRGGQLMTGTAPARCMSGFIARRNSDSKLGVVTAGHCIDTSYSVQDGATAVTVTPPSGMRVNNATMDLAYMTAAGAFNGVGEFYADGSGTARRVTATRSRASTNATNGTLTTVGTTTGSFVCHLGHGSYLSSYFVQSCGEVMSTAASNIAAPPSSGNFVLVRNTQSGAGTVRTSGPGTLQCFVGDSGGPWFAGNTAFGIMSRCAYWSGNGTGSSVTAYALYTSVDFFSNLGVTIVQ